MLKNKKIKSSRRFVSTLESKREPITKFNFVILVLWGTVATLSFTLIFTVYATVVFFGSLEKINTEDAFYKNSPIFRTVTYNNDKAFYRSNEIIKLTIINNTDESIYLAPCQYFNKFEKKILDKWHVATLATCEDAEILAESVSIEKISEKVEDSILARKLGEGMWRGVSTVYFGCEKTQIASCKNKQTIYTKEFIISEPEVAVFPNLQL